MLLLTLLASWLLSADADAASKREFKPVSVTKNGVVFHVGALKNKRVVRAKLVVKGKKAKRAKKSRKAKRKAKRVKQRTVRRVVVERAARRAGRLVVPLSDPGASLAGTRLVVQVSNTPPKTSSGPSAPISTGNCDVAWGQLGRGVTAGACWRPYGSNSPFNQQIPNGAPSDPRSDAIVRRTLGFGPIQHLLPGRAGTSEDWGRPIYFSRSSDPVYTVRCMKDWGTCPIEGEQVHIPGAAKPAGGADGHLTVIDQETGWEYDFWQVLSKGSTGGEVRISWGGKTRIDGDGLGSRAVASNYGTAAGIIRAEELRAGRIDHALFINVSCDAGKAVFPADHVGYACSNPADAPAMGQRFQLQMSDAEIDGLNAPTWKKAILRAMAKYGMFVGDTGGDIGIGIESGVSATSFGLPDPWVELAREAKAPYNSSDGVYVMNVREGVDWASRLRVVAPCVSQRAC